MDEDFTWMKIVFELDFDEFTKATEREKKILEIRTILSRIAKLYIIKVRTKSEY